MTAPANAFLGKSTRPSDSDLQRALGRAKPLWDELIGRLASEQDVSNQEWKSYSAKSGWALRLKRGQRTILWLTPSDGLFQVLFILSDKALGDAREERLPARVLRMLDEAPRYPEGTGVRLCIKAARDMPVVMKLAEIKVQS